MKRYRRPEDLDWNVKARPVPIHKSGHYTGRVYVRGWKALSNVLARKDVLAQPMQTSNRRLEPCRACPVRQQLWGQSQPSNTDSCFLSGLESTESPWPTHTRNGGWKGGIQKMKCIDSATWVPSDLCWWLWAKMSTGTNWCGSHLLLILLPLVTLAYSPCETFQAKGCLSPFCVATTESFMRGVV